MISISVCAYMTSIYTLTLLNMQEVISMEQGITTHNYGFYASVYENVGDSLVPYWSATLGDKYSDKTFYVSSAFHMDLIKNTQVKAFINDLISNNTSITSYSEIYTDPIQ